MRTLASLKNWKTTDAAITLAKRFQGTVVDSLPPAKPAMPLKINHSMPVSNAAEKRPAIKDVNVYTRFTYSDSHLCKPEENGATLIFVSYSRCIQNPINLLIVLENRELKLIGDCSLIRNLHNNWQN